MPWIFILNKISLCFSIMVAILLVIMCAHALCNVAPSVWYSIVFFSALIIATVSRVVAINLQVNARYREQYEALFGSPPDV